jgi:arylsulfatase A
MKFAFAIALFSSFSGFAQNLKIPNIIHILADDVGYDDLACFGAKDVRTPHLDKLAAEGLKLNNFYAPHGTCTPSRVALMTGKYVSRINNGLGMRVLFPTDSTGLDPKEEKSLAMYLKEVGYQTGLFGKWHLGHLPQYLPTKHGFDSYLGIPYPNDHGPERRGNTGHWPGFGAFPPIPLIQQDQVIKALDNNDLGELPALFVRESCRFMRQCAVNKQPFYLQYANIETHTPWFLPKGFEGRSGKGAYVDAVEYLDLSVGILLD